MKQYVEMFTVNSVWGPMGSSDDAPASTTLNLQHLLLAFGISNVMNTFTQHTLSDKRGFQPVHPPLPIQRLIKFPSRERRATMA